MAFLLLTLLVAGIIVGAVLLGRANRRGKRIEKRRKSVELAECVEKREEIPLAGMSSTGSDSERQINNSLVYHYERIQPNDQSGYESVDFGPQRHNSQVDGKGSRCKGDNYNVAEAAKKILQRTLDRMRWKGTSRMPSQEATKMQCMQWLTRARKRSKGRLRVHLNASFKKFLFIPSG